MSNDEFDDEDVSEECACNCSHWGKTLAEGLCLVLIIASIASCVVIQGQSESKTQVEKAKAETEMCREMIKNGYVPEYDFTHQISGWKKISSQPCSSAARRSSRRAVCPARPARRTRRLIPCVPS